MGMGTALGRGVGMLRGAARKDGAADSGLAALIELCFVNACGDAFVAISLATSVFFSLPVGQARSRVALYLLVTMAPFALLAPVIGPLLDRIGHGRRVAMAVSMLARAALSWLLATKLTGLTAFPLALGILVSSRGFGVGRAAVVPRVLPARQTLVGVNSRLSLVGVVAGVLVAPLGIAIGKTVGYSWTLRLTALVFLVGMFMSFTLPAVVDSAAGETPAKGLPKAALGGGGRGVRAMLGSLPEALRGSAALRALVGFLTFFLAFRLRQDGGGSAGIGVLAAAAALGSGIGVFLGGRLSRFRPERLQLVGMVAAAGTCVAVAFSYGAATGILAALVCTVSQSMAKLGLDAVIQRDVREEVRNSAFARSETALQLSWVAGGAVGLLPLTGREGFVLAGVAMVAAVVVELTALLGHAGRSAPARTQDQDSHEGEGYPSPLGVPASEPGQA